MDPVTALILGAMFVLVLCFLMLGFFHPARELDARDRDQSRDRAT
jgi:hypothetical protein